jgi:sporulation protein YlmC with PRC-barrel domain
MTDTMYDDETRELIASNRVEGTTVYNFEGERLGTISKFMVNKRSGQAEFAVLQFGGILGIGADYYPVPWEMLSYNVEQGGYVVDLDKEMLGDAPSYSDEEPAYDEDFDRRVYTHYGVPY